jgi:hypothetical protein
VCLEEGSVFFYIDMKVKFVGYVVFLSKDEFK